MVYFQTAILRGAQKIIERDGKHRTATALSSPIDRRSSHPLSPELAQSCSSILVSSHLSRLFEAVARIRKVSRILKEEGRKGIANRRIEIAKSKDGRKRRALKVRHFNGKRAVSMSNDHARRHGETANNWRCLPFLGFVHAFVISHRIPTLCMLFRKQSTKGEYSSTCSQVSWSR